MGKKVLLKDIAERVGSSIALVSYVLNNKAGRVGQEMTENIRRAAEEMGYRPNLVAKSLQSGKTNTLGLLVADISNAFFSQLARIIEDEAGRYGYTVIFGSTDENAEKSRLLTETFLNRQVDGLIIAPAAATEDQLKDLKKAKFPFVLVDRYFPSVTANSVCIDNYGSAYGATRYLLQAGRKKVALVTYRESDMAHFREREKGYRAALKEKRLSAQIVGVTYPRIDEDMSEGLEALLIGDSRADALFFATHSLAIAGLKCIDRLRIRVPEQVAVVSFDANDAFDLYRSPISYIRQPVAGIGKEAVKLLIEHIRQPGSKQSQVVLETELVIRKSI